MINAKRQHKGHTCTRSLKYRTTMIQCLDKQPQIYFQQESDYFLQLTCEQWNQYQKNKCVCPCQRSIGRPLSLGTPQRRFNFLGLNVRLFYFFAKHMILLVLLGVVVYSVFGSLVNQFSIYVCTDQTCQGQEDLLILQIQLWLASAVGAIYLLLIGCVRERGKQIVIDFDEGVLTSSDYAIKIDNLPYGQCQESDIYNIIKENSKTHPKRQRAASLLEQQLVEYTDEDHNHSTSQIKSIQIVYNIQGLNIHIDNIRDMCKQADLIISSKKEIAELRHDKNYQQLKKLIAIQIQLLNDTYRKFFSDPHYRSKKAATCAIVEFTNQDCPKEMLLKYGTVHKGLFARIRADLKNRIAKKRLTSWRRKSSKEYSHHQDQVTSDKLGDKSNAYTGEMFHGKIVSLNRAPEPEDLIWANCEKQYNPLRELAFWSLALLIIAVSFAIIVGLNYAKIVASQQDDAKIWTPLISISMVIVNLLLVVAMKAMLSFESSHTLSELIVSVSDKLIFSQVLNSIFLPVIIYSQFQPRLANTGQTHNVLSRLALSFAISNCIIPNLLLLCSPALIFKKIVRSCKLTRNFAIRVLSRNIVNPAGQTSLDCINQFYIDGQFQAVESYNYIMLTVLHAFFFCSIEPVVLIVALLALIFNCGAQKYLFLRRYPKPKLLDETAFLNSLEILSYGPILFGVGGILFCWHSGKTNWLILLPFGISVLLGVIHLSDLFGWVTQAEQRLYKRITIKGREFRRHEIQNSRLLTHHHHHYTRHNSTQHLSTQDQIKVSPRDYVFNNNINTLVARHRILLGQGITLKDRLETKEFVENCVQQKLNYPQGSSHSECQASDNLTPRFDRNQQSDHIDNDFL